MSNSRIQKFTIITPCYNADKYIKDTVESVLSQTALQQQNVALEYIICDGGSTDDTLGILQAIDAPEIQVISEKDNGMYDALSKGLKLATGDVCAYLGAGDLYSSTCFAVVMDVMEQLPQINWLTGLAVSYNDKGQVTDVKLPFVYRNAFFQKRIYGDKLPYLQQESTFWRSSLNALVPLTELARLRLAGDYFIWKCFSEQQELYNVESFLGGFRIHPGQQSADNTAYQAELSRFTKSPNLIELAISLFDNFIWWFTPSFIKKNSIKKDLSVTTTVNRNGIEWFCQ